MKIRGDKKVAQKIIEYQAGYTAFCNGQKIESCQYDICNPFGKSWRAGYWQAKYEDNLTNPILNSTKRG